MISMFLDLEMNQPSGKIIEVGVCIGDTCAEIGQFIWKEQWLIDPHEPINTVKPNDIVGLTGITDQMIAENNSPIEVAHLAMVMMAQHHGCGRNLWCWGGDDADYLRMRVPVENNMNFWFAPTIYDIKKQYQFTRQAHGRGTQSGLALSLTKVGLAFVGKKHRAMDDAYNTLRMAQFLTKATSEVKIDWKK